MHINICVILSSAAQQDSSISNIMEPPESEMYDPEEQLSSKQKYIGKFLHVQNKMVSASEGGGYCFSRSRNLVQSG